MKAGKEPRGTASCHEVAEILLAELRESRKRLQHLVRLVHEAAGRELQARQGPTPPPRCRTRSRKRKTAGAS